MDYKEKATILRVCSSKKGERCSHCPAFGQGFRNCMKNAMKDGAAAITDLLDRAEAAEAEIGRLRNEHLKIQYGGEELTVQEICERLERAEKKALDGWNTLDSLYGTCGKYCDDKISEYFHRWI